MAIKIDANGELAVYNQWSSDITYQDYRDRSVSLLLLLGAIEDGRLDQCDVKNVCGIIMDMLPSDEDYRLLDLAKGGNKL